MAEPGKPEKRPMSAGDLYRLMRMLHTYLSALAFAALIFFSLTGLTLNHPEWFAGKRPPETVTPLKLDLGAVAKARSAPDPAQALAELARSAAALPGAYASGEIIDGEALIRFEGPSGVADVNLSLATGEGEAAVRKAGLIARLNDLHKGKAASLAWRTLIDICAVAFIALSAVGLVLFFSLRFRLKPSLALIAAGLVVLAAAGALIAG